MADTIERTIYRLELDGSAYIEGADKLSNSTNKLSQAQEAANKKLAELQKQHSSYKKTLQETTDVLKANEKETLELTKKLNDLKAAGKGASAEANRLKAELRGLSVNTKEFRSEANELKTRLLDTNNQLKAQTKIVKEAEVAQKGFASGITKAYSGLRILANIIPGVGIAGLVGLIAGPLVDAFQSWYDSMEDTNNALKLLKANQENLNEVMANADKAAGKQIIDLKILYQAATDVNLSMDDRLKAVRALRQEFPDYFKDVKTETILNGEAKSAYDALAASILSTARATATKGKLDDLEAQRLDIAFKKQQIRADAAKQKTDVLKKNVNKALATDEFGNAVSVLSPQEQARDIQQQADNNLALEDQKDKLLASQEDFLIKFAGLANIAKTIEDEDNKKFKDKKDKQTKEIVNIYEQELQKLKADIAKLDEKGFSDEATITKAVDEDFKKRSLAFEKAFRNKQLTAPQLESLKVYLKNLQDLTLQTQLKGFREARAQYLAAINDEIVAVQSEESLKRIAAIQDSFERDRQTINTEADKTTKALEAKRDKQISDITKNAAKHGLTPADVAPLIEQIKDNYSKLLDDLQVIKAQKLQQLSFDTFEKLSEDAKRTLDQRNLDVSTLANIEIKQQTELFLQGKINYKKYQEELTRIAKEESEKRVQNEINKLRIEINRRESELRNNRALTEPQQQQLLDEIRSSEAQLNTLERGQDISSSKDKSANAGESRLDRIAKYAQAIGQVANSVVQFWQDANEAEEKALDRSISLQEKRVAAAQRIADRGNAQYLKQEEDRLTELNVKRENAARKELGINAALTASQALVAFITAIAQGAKVGGALGALIDAAAIIALIGTGFSIVKNLQDNQPKLAKGTKYLKREGHPSGTDTIPVMANEGEAVIPTDKNKAYHPTVAAIYDGTIPAEHLNQFVNHYHKIKAVPQPNYERIKDAAELKIGHDGRMSVLLVEQNKKLEENNDLQRQVLRAMKTRNVSAKIDRDGIAIAVNEYVEQLERDKRL